MYFEQLFVTKFKSWWMLRLKALREDKRLVSLLNLLHDLGRVRRTTLHSYGSSYF